MEYPARGRGEGKQKVGEGMLAQGRVPRELFVQPLLHVLGCSLIYRGAPAASPTLLPPPHGIGRGRSFAAVVMGGVEGGRMGSIEDARGCYEWKHFLEDRNWGAVKQFYARTLVDSQAMHDGTFPLCDVGSDLTTWIGNVDGGDNPSAPANTLSAANMSASNSHWRKGRTTWLAEIAYVGANFSGLQRAPGQRTVVGELEKSVAPLVQAEWQKTKQDHLKQEQKNSRSIPGLAQVRS